MSAELDDRLMTAVRAGDVSQLGVLFERHHRALFNFFLRLTGDRQGSEDLVQDVFLRLLKARGTYRPGTRFRAWMYQVARSAHVDRHRARPHEVAPERDVPEPAAPGPPPSAQLERDAEAAVLRRAMARLPASKREVLVLSRFQGLRYEEIGAILGCEEGAVKVRVFRAIRALRAAYGELVGQRVDRRTPPPRWAPAPEDAE